MQLDRFISGHRFIEAPRVDVEGALYYTDLVGGGVYKRSPDGRSRHFLSSRRWIGGLLFNEDDGFVCSGLGGLVHFNEATGVTRPLLTAIEGKPIIAINDIYADDHGSIYGGTVDFAAIENRNAPSKGVLFRLDPPDSLTILRSEVTVSNGIGLSPDRRRLYHSDTSVGVWVARFESGKLGRYAPDGKVNQEFELPVREVVSLTFAGRDMRDLYVAAGGDIYDSVQRGAAIYVGRSPVAGQLNPKSKF